MRLGIFPYVEPESEWRARLERGLAKYDKKPPMPEYPSYGYSCMNTYPYYSCFGGYSRRLNCGGL